MSICEPCTAVLCITSALWSQLGPSLVALILGLVAPCPGHFTTLSGGSFKLAALGCATFKWEFSLFKDRPIVPRGSAQLVELRQKEVCILKKL